MTILPRNLLKSLLICCGYLHFHQEASWLRRNHPFLFVFSRSERGAAIMRRSVWRSFPLKKMESPFRCRFCGNSYRIAQERDKCALSHIQQVEIGGYHVEKFDNYFKCPDPCCEEVFSRPQLLRVHFYNEVSHYTNYCDKVP